MIFSGDNYISLPEVDSLSFNIPISIDSVGGTGSFGFSGSGVDGKERLMQFVFESGKVKDFNGNYVHSYFPNNIINFSGDIFPYGHIYYINDHPTNLSGTQDYFKFKRFFYNSDGINITSVANLYIQEEPIITWSTLAQVTPALYDSATIQHFDISGSYTGAIEKSVEFDVFSSSIEGGNANLFSLFETDLNAGKETGSFILKPDSSVSLNTDKIYTFSLNLNTNFGSVSKPLIFFGANFSAGIRKKSFISQKTNRIDLASIARKQFGDAYTKKRNSYNLIYSLSESGIEKNKPLGTELSYYAGDTGIFSGFTGDITITNGGKEYISGETFVTATGAGGSGFIADVLTDSGLNGNGKTGAITGFTVTNSGENYTGNVNVQGVVLTISGESGQNAVLDPVTFSYTKHFFETWDLHTGYYGSDTLSFSGSAYTGTDNVSVTRHYDSNYGGGNLLTNTNKVFSIDVDWFAYWDTGNVVAKLRVTGDNFDENIYITGTK